MSERASASLATLFVALILFINVRGVPAFAFHPEWRDLSILTDRFLGELGSRIDAAGGGEIIEVGGLPYGSRRRPGSPIVLAAGMTDYTVQAWTDLAYPSRNIRVAFPLPAPPPPAEDEVLVIVRVERE